MVNTEKYSKYYYLVHGLTIESDIMLNELVTATKSNGVNVDVIITYGIVPKKIDEAVVITEYLQTSENETVFFVKGIAHFYIGNGNSIIIEPEKNSKFNDMKIYLIGGCIGTILTQRNLIGIHGSSVVLEGGGIIISGHSGAGKSTLTTAFRKEGYAFLSDDVSVLEKNVNGNIIIYPAYPQQKLCRDAMESMGFHIQKYTLIDQVRDKYAVPINSHFHEYEVLLTAIFEISIGEVNQLRIAPVLGNEKLKVILRNIYGIELTSLIGINPIYFKKCMEVAQKIPIYRITRPKEGFTVNEQMRLIKETLNKKSEYAV